MKEVELPLEQESNFEKRKMLGRKLVKGTKGKKLILLKDVRNQALENVALAG